MRPDQVILDYLTYAPSKSTTILGIVILFDQLNMNKDHIVHYLVSLAKDDKIEIIYKEPRETTTIRLIPKLRSI